MNPIMLILLLVSFLVVVWIILKVNRIHIDWHSLIQPTLPLDTSVFGVYCFTGHQGSGKTYSLAKFIQKEAQGMKIYSNVTLKNIDYEPIKSLEHLYSLADEKNIFIIYDEIFSLMSKSKKDAQILEQFLPQMRKVHNKFLTTAQYWLELDVTFRRFVRIQIECKTRPLGKFGGILREEYFDAENIKWSNIENEFVSPRIMVKFSKYEKRYMESYDTFERIKKLARS